MKKVLFLASCSKNEKETKNKIFQMLTSHGVKKENILFTDSLNEKNAMHFSSFKEFERFVSERKTNSHISKSFFPLSKF